MKRKALLVVFSALLLSPFSTIYSQEAGLTFSLAPGEQQMQQLRDHATSDEGEIVNVNLLRFRDRPQYPDNRNVGNATAQEVYQRYLRGVSPLLEQAGAEVVYLGSTVEIINGPQTEGWDLVAIVRYPSAWAFLSMFTSEAYQRADIHRTASILDSRSIMTRMRDESH